MAANEAIMVKNTISTILSVNIFSPGVTARSVMSCALPLPKPKALLADKGYDGDRFRENLLLRGILPIIPPRSKRKAPTHPDYRRYKDRNRIERMFGKLTPRCHSIGQDRPVIRELPQPRRSANMAEIFCQHGLGTECEAIYKCSDIYDHGARQAGTIRQPASTCRF